MAKFEKSKSDREFSNMEGSKAEESMDKKQRKPRMSSLKANVMRHLGQRK